MILKKFTATALSVSLACMFVGGFAGCEKKTETKSTTTTTSPEGGKTTTEHSDTVKQSGENPSPAR